MSAEQQAARVNVNEEDWIDFRTLAMRRKRSIAAYLGELVRRELDRQRPQRSPATEPSAPPKPATTVPKPRVRLADQELLLGLPKRAPESPTWEE